MTRSNARTDAPRYESPEETEAKAADRAVANSMPEVERGFEWRVCGGCAEEYVERAARKRSECEECRIFGGELALRAAAAV